MSVMDHLLYALMWLSFGLLHTFLAGPTAKASLKGLFGRAYRLAYNGFATLHLGAIFLGGRWYLAGKIQSFDLPALATYSLLAMQGLGLIVLLLALKQYDRGLFLGTKQLTANTNDTIDGDEPLNTGGLNRYMRHPIYTGSFLLLWGLIGSDFGLATAFWASLYLVVGTYFEERKLVAKYGDSYRAYQQSVPAFFPAFRKAKA